MKPARTPLTLAQQEKKLRRALAARVKDYDAVMRMGRMTAEKRLAEEAGLNDVWRTFRWIVANADWIKAEERARKHRARIAADLDELGEDATTAVLDAFPDATIRPAQEQAA